MERIYDADMKEVQKMENQKLLEKNELGMKSDAISNHGGEKTMENLRKKTIFILLSFIVMNLMVFVMPYHTTLYVFSSFMFACPIIVGSFHKTNKYLRIDEIEMEPGHILTKIRTNKALRYLVNIIVGTAFAYVLPVMLYLIDFSEYVAMLLLVSAALFFNKVIIKGRAYKKDFRGRAAGTRGKVVGVVEACIYPVIWFVLDKRLPNTCIFGTIDDLTGIPRMIGLFVDAMNQIVRTVSEYSGATIVTFLLLVIVNGGILFVGMYRFFYGLLLKKEDVDRIFSKPRYEIHVTAGDARGKIYPIPNGKDNQ